MIDSFISYMCVGIDIAIIVILTFLFVLSLTCKGLYLAYQIGVHNLLKMAIVVMMIQIKV